MDCNHQGRNVSSVYVRGISLYSYLTPYSKTVCVKLQSGLEIIQLGPLLHICIILYCLMLKSDRFHIHAIRTISIVIPYLGLANRFLIIP